MMLTLPLSMLMLLIRIVLIQRKQGQQSFSKPRNDNVQATSQGAKSRVSHLKHTAEPRLACNISRVFLVHFSSLIEIGLTSARSYRRKRKNLLTLNVRLCKQGSKIWPTQNTKHCISPLLSLGTMGRFYSYLHVE